MNYSDQHREIVEGCIQGKRQDQFELYRLYSKAMYNICLRMVRNEADAEDLLQNSFMDIFRKLDQFKFQSSIGAWIKRITINNCINFLKKNKLITEDINDFQIENKVEQEPEDYLISVEGIKSAIKKLPEGYRVVFSLYAMEGYDHSEIAEIMEINVATSKSQYSRAKKKLKELLSESLRVSN